MRRFWVLDNFIREEAKKYTAHTVNVYIYLCSRADKLGETYVGYRRIAEDLGMNKNTVCKAVKKLIASGKIIRLDKKHGNSYYLKLTSVLNESVGLSDGMVHKELNKKLNKEPKNTSDSKKNYTPIKNGYVYTLHDGTKAIKKFGTWVDANNPSIKIDLTYYTELKDL